MGGEFSSKSQQDCSNGIYFLAARDVFHLLNTKYKTLNLTASASYFEIYSGKVFDLLNAKAKLRILEDGRQQVQIVNLKEEDLANIDDVSRLIQTGSAVRTSGVTSANNHSSRSHAVFQIILRARLSRKLHGKFSLVDLAGNERGADTFSSDRQTRTEGAEINKSLLALKIAMISPSMSSCEHTLNTLRYADRVKELGVSGSLNVEQKAMEVEQTASDENAFELTNDEDFALLRNSAEVVSQELMNFHNAVDQTQEQEEELISSHCQLIQSMDSWRESYQQMLKSTDTIDYDVEVYTAELDQLLAQNIACLTAIKDKVEKFRRELANEENLLKTLRMSNNRSS